MVSNEGTGLDALLERSPLPFAILTREMRVTRANPAFAAALHVPSGALPGRTLSEAGVHPSVVESWAKPLEEAFVHGAPQTFEFDGPPDRTLRILVANVAPVGESALVTLDDITEARALRVSQAEAIARAQDAQRHAEEGAWRGRVLALVAGFLEEDMPADAILQRVARIVVPDLADVCLVEMPDGRGGSRVAATAAESPLHEDILRKFHGGPVPDESALASLRVAHGIVVPLATRERTHGTMRLWFTRAYRRHRPDEVAFAEQIARRAAVALEQARRLAESDASRRAANAARAEAERVSARAHVLSTASGTLGSARSPTDVASALAQACVPHVADCALVDVLRNDGALERAGIAHADAQKQALLRDLAARQAPDALGLPRIAATVGAGILLSDVGDAEIAAWGKDDTQKAMLRALAPKSYLVVPIAAEGRLLGLLSLTSSTPARRYGAEDLALARDLAARAAAAMQRAAATESVTAARHDQEDARAILDILAHRRGITYGLVDARMRFVRVSDSLARLHGRPVAAHAGRDVREAPPELAEVYLPLLRNVIASGEPVTNHAAQTPRGLLVLAAYPVQTSQGPGALLVVDA